MQNFIVAQTFFFCTYYDLQGWTVTRKSRAIRIRKEKRKVHGKGN